MAAIQSCTDLNVPPRNQSLELKLTFCRLVIQFQNTLRNTARKNKPGSDSSTANDQSYQNQLRDQVQPDQLVYLVPD